MTLTVFAPHQPELRFTWSVATLPREEGQRLIRVYSPPAMVAKWRGDGGGTEDTSYSTVCRDPVLEALDRLDQLMDTLRAKYGEFDVDRDLEELRAERLSALG